MFFLQSIKLLKTIANVHVNLKNKVCVESLEWGFSSHSAATWKPAAASQGRALQWSKIDLNVSAPLQDLAGFRIFMTEHISSWQKLMSLPSMSKESSPHWCWKLCLEAQRRVDEKCISNIIVHQVGMLDIASKMEYGLQISRLEKLFLWEVVWVQQCRAYTVGWPLVYCRELAMGKDRWGRRKGVVQLTKNFEQKQSKAKQDPDPGRFALLLFFLFGLFFKFLGKKRLLQK